LATSAAAEAAPTRPVPPTNTTFLVAGVAEASDARAPVDRRRFAARATFADDARSAVDGETRELGAADARHIADADMVVCVGRTTARGRSGGRVPNADDVGTFRCYPSRVTESRRLVVRFAVRLSFGRFRGLFLS
jgi:hypothetical protein